MKALMTLVAAVALLTGCGTSPFKGKSDNEIVRFLLRASEHAETQTSFGHLKGAGFLGCMTNNVLHLDCGKLFNDMQDFAQHIPGFSDVKVADIKNRTLFERIEALYRQQQFTSQ